MSNYLRESYIYKDIYNNVHTTNIILYTRKYFFIVLY